MEVYDKGVVRVLDPLDRENNLMFLVNCDWQECWKPPDGSMVCLRWEQDDQDQDGTGAAWHELSDNPLFLLRDDNSASAFMEFVLTARHNRQEVTMYPGLQRAWAGCLLDIEGPYLLIKGGGCELFWDENPERHFTFLRHLVPGDYWWVRFYAKGGELIEAALFLFRLSQQPWLKAVVITGGELGVVLLVVSDSRQVFEVEPEQPAAGSVVLLRTTEEEYLPLDCFRLGMVVLPLSPGAMVTAADLSCISERGASLFRR